MDILFLCHRIPFPPDKGDKIRSHALLTHLAKRHRVHLACFVDDPKDMQYAGAVRQLAGGRCLFVPLTAGKKWMSAAQAILTGQPITVASFSSPAIKKWIDEVLAAHNIERTVVFSSAMAPFVLDAPQMDPATAVLDLVDVDSDKWRQYASRARGIMRWIYAREAETLAKLECAAAQRFKATVLVSRYEAQSLSGMSPASAARIFALNNGVNRDFFVPGNYPNPFAPGEQPIVMTGRLDYLPNADGASWFLKEVMPRFRERLPRARLHVIGANPPRSLRALEGSELSLAGHVKDVRPYLQHASAVVAPLRIARGVQNKVLEAMSMARPVVATSAATRALEAISAEHLWIADDPAEFADAVISAVQGGNRLEVAGRARGYVERHHDWARNLSRLDDLLDVNPNQETREDVGTQDVRSVRPSNAVSYPPAVRPSIAGLTP